MPIRRHSRKLTWLQGPVGAPTICFTLPVRLVSQLLDEPVLLGCAAGAAPSLSAVARWLAERVCSPCRGWPSSSTDARPDGGADTLPRAVAPAEALASEGRRPGGIGGRPAWPGALISLPACDGGPAREAGPVALELVSGPAEGSGPIGGGGPDSTRFDICEPGRDGKAPAVPACVPESSLIETAQLTKRSSHVHVENCADCVLSSRTSWRLWGSHDSHALPC